MTAWTVVLAAFLAILGCAAFAPHAAGTPYQGIVDRNLFGLKPPPPPPKPEEVKPPLPDILLTGITTILGDKRVLLKLPAKAPQRPKDEFYILKEGQRDGEIEVLSIDPVAGTVKVNNHGTVQTLDFVNNGVKVAGATPAPGAPVAPGAPPPRPGMLPQMNIPPPGAAGGFRQIPPRPLRATPGSEQGSSSIGAPNPGVVTAPAAVAGNLQASLGVPPPPSTRLEDSPQFTHPFSGEQQDILIEAERARLLDAGDIENANLLPVTDLTPQ
jgi:hypothetical protein